MSSEDDVDAPPPIVGRALGVDFGTKRIGLALSDDLGWFAEPLEVWARRSEAEDLGHIAGLVAQHEARRIVVGMPLRLHDQGVGPSALLAQAFVDALRARIPAEVPIDTRDEGLTSWAAEERMKAKGLSPKERRAWVDAYAAAVILQEDLDARRRR
jgi:putative Holliday junction resolvase